MAKFSVLIMGERETSDEKCSTLAEARKLARFYADNADTEGWMHNGTLEGIDFVYVFPAVEDDDGYLVADSDATPFFAWSRDR